jgi:zinc protease
VKRVCLLIPVLALVWSCSATSTAKKSSPDSIPQVAIEKHRLDNGLEVFFVEDHRLPRVAVNLWYHVGPVNEEPGRTGFAHLFEHMMFQQSKHIPQDQFFKLLEAAGGSDMNGTTDFDRTNYFETVPTHELELALWMESDRMGYLLDTLDQAALENQQDVVRNERRQRIENSPFGIVDEAMYHNLFPKGHPYYAEVMGSHADIQAAKIEDVRKFFKQYYTPNNASLAIVGDIDKVNTLKLVEKYFGPLKKGPDVPAVNVTTPPITSERRVVVKDRVELPRVYMAWITPSAFQPGDAEADITATVLGNGKSSRLYRRLVYEKQIAQDVTAYQYSLMLGSTFVIQATARPMHTLDELEKEINDVLEALRTKGPDSKEMDRAQATIETGIVQSLEKFGGFSGIADRINRYNHFVKNPDYVAQDIQRYRNVTAMQVQEFATKYLTNGSRVVVHGVPGEPDFGPAVPTPPKGKAAAKSEVESVNADEPWRAQRPAPGKAAELKVPVPDSFQLSNGLTVLLNQRKGVPVISANLMFKSGSGVNPVDKPGLAAFAMDMLDEGTQKRSSTQFADDVAQIGASFDISSRRDSSSLTLTSMASKFATGMDLMADAVLNPTFPPEEIERVRQSRLASLVQLKEDPDQIANRMVPLAVNGTNDPQGFPTLGTESSIRVLNAEELKAFWTQQINPANAGLIVSGDIGKDELRELIEKAFANWKSSSPVESPKPVALQSSSRVILVDKPGAQQTQLRFVSQGPPRSTPDYETIEVMNGILGGAFSSRINLNLREDKGYTYGAFSFFTYLRDRGWFTASSPVRTDVTGPATRETMREIARMAETPVTADELRLSKESLIGGLPAQLEANADTVVLLGDIYLFNLPLDYFSGYMKKVTGVTDRMVQEVSQKYLLPKTTTVIAVGDRKRIEPELKKLNLGPMEYRDLDGNLIVEERRN